MVTLTIDDVPEPVRDQLVARAARAGRPLQDYLLDQLTRIATRPTPDDIAARARAQPKQEVGDGAA
ncbi:MAG: FitA-like ribbon-helix-helix domain-containing protein [Frankia sp.]